MTVAKTYPRGVPSWVDTEQPDLGAAQEFYGALFGWTFTPAGPGYVIATLGGFDVAGLGAGSGVWNTYIAVDDADDTAAAAGVAGADILSQPQDAGPGGRTATLRDPQGAEFRLWRARRRLGAQLVNAPGSWNFSDLHTSDLDAALRFYTPLFGWRSAGFAGNEEDGGMIAVPGYGDHLASTSDPEIHERQKNAPEGFADVIGALVPLADGDTPHWRVTFSVADRDESSAAVQRLGGTVVDQSESQWARLAILRDPAGAEFSISQFTPPESY